MLLPMQSRVRGDKIEHRWRLTVHMDGCHWFQSIFVCVDCGASIATYDERDFNADPWSAVWMDEDAYEGEDGHCQRCAEIRDGAEPAHTVAFEAGRQ